jgi:cyanophycin synthetase
MVEPAEDIEDALIIPIPSAESLVLDDYRRLTGPGLLWKHAGAVLDVFVSGHDLGLVIERWQFQARRVLDAIGWQDENIIAHPFAGGVNLAISAPMDQLYSAIFTAQTAWHFAAAEVLEQPSSDFETMISDLKSVMVREANPPLINLINAATVRGVDALSDDDDLSLGHGIGSKTWSVLDLPAPEDVAWDELHNVPVVLITGTNGKTTTTRLSSAIASAAGLVAGLTSTEFVRVGEDILDRGDYSGPGGARMLLRDRRLEIAYLEVARGGILRRGLPLRQARAALVTNVAADHLGQYGVNTVEELAVAKFAVHRSLAADGVLVLNADDEFVVAEARRTDATIWWFSLTASSPHIRNALEAGTPCAWFDGNALVFFDGREQSSIIDVRDIPLTLNGAARYNISNALGALCLSRALGLADDAIRSGLSGFQSDPKDNPGRCNEFSVNGARVFIDFAHNPHSVSAVTETMAAIPAKRRFVLLGHAGDRSDQDIRDLTISAFALKPDYVVAVEMPEYLRGREPGEITDLILDECRVQGLADDRMILRGTPSEGVASVIDLLASGDLALLLVLSERDKVFEMLERLTA